ncbi:MAG: hypothetical protein KC944_07350, partial [Candidatus Omnitrophica bacterium]|nr:hypothetical protein [Candidatus Omnitrophota bacterium]
MKRLSAKFILTTLLLIHAPAYSIPAFPGAEGFGAETVGGRGGRVLQVTNLNDKGPGSLREAVEAEGPRTVVFRISGTIPLEKSIVVKNPYLTIAGQTAPGDGICLKDAGLVINASEVIVRFLRVRPGDESGYVGDAISVGAGKNILIDHCSCTWSNDETLSVSTGDNPLDNVTVQWCLISESLNDSLHEKGEHGYGSLIRGHHGSKFTFNHNLYSHHKGRSPRPGVYDKWDHEQDPDGLLLEFRNNVIYDWYGSHAGYNADKESVTRMDYIGNYLIPGVDSAEDSVAYQEGSIYNKSYFAGNWMNEEKAGRENEVRFPKTYTPEMIQSYFQQRPFTDSGATSGTIHYDVFSDVGACLPRRDSVDERIIDQAKKKTGGIINSQSEVGGWPKLESQPAPPDRDHDGMPDKWEERMGFNPDDSADGTADSDGDGYTNLDEYLEEKCVGLDHTVIEGDKFAFDWGPPGPPFKGTRDEFLNASKDLSIRLSSDKTIYRIGEPVFANLEFTNDSGYPFWIHPVQASINNPLEIVDPSGKKAVWKGESVSSVDSESPV